MGDTATDGTSALPPGYRRIAIDRVASTNDEARRFADAGAGERLVVTGEVQTAGRGRQGRAWVSPHGNLYSSFLLRPAVKPAQAGEFGFGVSVAVAETVERLAPGQTATCKWPNDVLVAGRKIAGILLESRGTPDTLDWLIVGIGVNVAEFPEDSAWPATSIAALGGAAEVERALETLAARLDHWYRLWLAEGFTPLRQAWLARAHALGETLKIKRNGDEREGKFAGLDPSGALVLEVADGRRETISYGEIAIREQP
jgi:BirA family transcriptional regulator, biotin operon repressor / biotin---[acetyl-CoA-carboxylase] ligase